MVNSYDKPLMITEFSSSTVGGDKVKWTRDMFEALKKFDKIKVAIWFSGTDLDENKKILQEPIKLMNQKKCCKCLRKIYQRIDKLKK